MAILMPLPCPWAVCRYGKLFSYAECIGLRLRYKGDAFLQKEFTVDFLNKKTKKNEGEVPQYYVEGNHEASINPTVFDMVQAELDKRKRGGSRYSGVSIFSDKIK